MEAIIKIEKGIFMIEPKGRLDTVSSAELKAQIEGYDSKGCDIDFDLTGVEYISSAGLRLLVALQKQVKADGKQLTLRNPNKVVKEVFSVAGFSKAFNIV